MAEFVKLIDVSKCTGCRGCQVACKNWNELPAEKTSFLGSRSLQNPPELSYNTWTLIRFDEVNSEDGKLKWVMRHDACLHCETPACAKACPSPGALVKTAEGAVVHDPKYCIGCKACISACPFNIPRNSAAEEKMAKCSLCYDRITNGKKPACVTACPTGCLDFGYKDDMIAKAHKKAEASKGAIYPDNHSYGTNVLYVMPAGVKLTDLQNVNPKPGMPTTILWWKNLFKPFTLIGMGAVAGFAALHYFIKGPHLVEKKKEGGE